MKKIITTAVIVASACGVFGAREILAENTTSHAVRKGDTLWDLSEDYLHDPLLWPKIWKVNPEIANPHRIKPGQVVRIPDPGKAPAREAAAAGEVVPVESSPSPLARAGLASTSEPLPIIVGKKELSSGDDPTRAGQMDDPARYYDRGIGIVSDEIPNEGRVLRTERGWQSAALGETIFIAAPGAQVGRQFGVYRDLGKVESLGYFEKSPGHLLAEIAIVEVVASDATGQRAVIRRAYAEVRTDDLLGSISARIRGLRPET